MEEKGKGKTGGRRGTEGDERESPKKCHKTQPRRELGLENDVQLTDGE